jgi:RNA polymerase sigma factor (sigma-70 family)
METDGQLLRRFLETKDEQCFAEIVTRHSSLVVGVCQRVLGNPSDADDAFQATFLVLLRKMSGLTSWDSIAGWLYQVALRTALNLRKGKTVDEQRREEVMENKTLIDSEPEPVWEELRPVLDEELGKIPEKLRLPLVLCYLEGKSYEFAAEELNISHSALKMRLERARDALRTRLTRRGLGVSGSALAVLISQNASVKASQPLTESVINIANSWMTKASSFEAGVSIKVSNLMKSTLQNLFIQKLKTATLVLALISFVCMGTFITAKAIFLSFRK